MGATSSQRDMFLEMDAMATSTDMVYGSEAAPFPRSATASITARRIVTCRHGGGEDHH
jgi:hypothetical protein